MPRLILVYNADNGLFNAITDTVHKVLSPRTYSCSLCRFTYGVRGMVLRWSNYLESVGHDLEFLHRNEFRERFGDANVELPLILVEDEGDLDVVLSADEINTCEDLDELIERLEAKLATTAIVEVP